MKNIILSFLSIVFITQSSSAQDCTKELLARKPGTWKGSQQGFIQNVTATDLTKEKAVIATIHKMVSTNYKPTGCEVSYSTAFGKHLPAAKFWIADPFQYVMYILKFMCDVNSTDKTKYNVQISTSTTVNIYANSVGWIGNLYAATLPDDEPRGYLKMKNKPQLKDGFYYSEEADDISKPQFVKKYQWLITYNDTLPFLYVSKKEYLLLTKRKLEKTIGQAGSTADYYNKFMKNINDHLKKSESELSNPAICMWNDEEMFEGFVEEGTQGSFYAIKPNPDYYHSKLPKSSPQFFTVVYKVVHGDPVYDENISNIKKAVDFATLKSMLGK